MVKILGVFSCSCACPREGLATEVTHERHLPFVVRFQELCVETLNCLFAMLNDSDRIKSRKIKQKVKSEQKPQIYKD